MHLSQILVSLSQPADDPAKLARLGFLEWLGGLPSDARASDQAQDAVIRMHSFITTSPAVDQFRGLLAQAALPLPSPRRQGGARGRRVLH